MENFRIKEILYSEEGSVESSLVLIPSLLIFLIVIQLAISVYDRSSVQLKTQEYARVVGLDGYSYEQAEYARDHHIATTFVPMPSGRKLVVSHSLSSQAALSNSLIPFMGGVPVSVFGFAISEQGN